MEAPIVLHPLQVNGQTYVRISVPVELETPQLKQVLQRLKAQYSTRWMAYLLPAQRGIVGQIFSVLKPFAWIDYSAYRPKPKTFPGQKERRTDPISITTLHQRAWEEFQHLLDARGYAENTKRTYLSMVATMMEWFSGQDLDRLENADLNRFFSQYVVAKGYSLSFQRQMIGAIKLFYSKRPERKLDLERVQYPRKAQPLPKILSLEEIGRLLASVSNMKHRCLIALQYGCGLRVSELLRLRLRDLWMEDGLLFIRGSKGQKDRRVKLSSKLVAEVGRYRDAYRPTDYLFEGQQGGLYSANSVNQVLQKAAKAAGIKRKVSSHMLRHSYATHLMDRGIDLRIIQELLGHKSSRTTEIYTHVSQRLINDTPSPFDFLEQVPLDEIKNTKHGDNPKTS